MEYVLQSTQATNQHESKKLGCQLRLGFVFRFQRSKDNSLNMSLEDGMCF